MDKKQTIFDDIKEIKGYILGVITFSTTFTVFLTQVIKTPIDITLISTSTIAGCLLFIGFLINRSEQRQILALAKQEEISLERVESFKNSVEDIKNLAIETRLDNLRTLLTLYIHDQPENHDTILKIAEKYFIEFKGDWVMTDEFLKWADAEKQAGRPVFIPSNLGNIVSLRAQEEKE